MEGNRRTYTQADIRDEIARLVQEQMRLHKQYGNRVAQLHAKRVDQFNIDHDPIVMKASGAAQVVAILITGLVGALPYAPPDRARHVG